MSGPAPLRVAVVGCGDIAQRYGETLGPHESVRIAGATDLLADRASAFVDRFGGRSYESLDDVLRDDEVDVVCNLTIHQAHEGVIRRSLEAGKHVFSEKPLTLDPATAQDLVRLADECGLRLGCAPSVFLGEAQQTAWKLVRDGAVGVPRVAYAEVNWGRPETWHGNPIPFYEVGAVFDVGVYPLTILTTMFGPARRVSSLGSVLLPERTTLGGEVFNLETPDFAVALVEWDGGPVARLTADFYVSPFTRQQGIEVHGDEGSVYLASFYLFDAKVERAAFGKRGEATELVRKPYAGCEWSRGLVEMAAAIGEGRPHRVTGVQAAHVVEIASAVHASIRDGRPVELTSTFTVPEPMEWAR